ncbi:hypothetical protein Q8A73_023266 [Channa argus]|nr:hypothetical protein Q8A73_023266 [Channa argus]
MVLRRSETFGGGSGASDRHRWGEIRSRYTASSSVPDNTQQDNGSAISMTVLSFCWKRLCGGPGGVQDLIAPLTDFDGSPNLESRSGLCSTCISEGSSFTHGCASCVPAVGNEVTACQCQTTHVIIFHKGAVASVMLGKTMHHLLLHGETAKVLFENPNARTQPVHSLCLIRAMFKVPALFYSRNMWPPEFSLLVFKKYHLSFSLQEELDMSHLTRSANKKPCKKAESLEQGGWQRTHGADFHEIDTKMGVYTHTRKKVATLLFIGACSSDGGRCLFYKEQRNNLSSEFYLGLDAGRENLQAPFQNKSAYNFVQQFLRQAKETVGDGVSEQKKL